MKRLRIPLAILVPLFGAAAPATAGDVVVIRRVIASPVPKATVVAPKCGTLTASTWGKDTSTPSVQNNLGFKASAAQALAACNAFLADKPGKKGTCQWDVNSGSSSGPSYFIENRVTYNPGAGFSGLYASYCQ